MYEQQRKQICDTHKRGLACHDCVVSGLVSGLVCDFDWVCFGLCNRTFIARRGCTERYDILQCLSTLRC